IQQSLAKENLGGNIKSGSEHYDETYELLTLDKFDEVIGNIEEAKVLYTEQHIYQRQYDLLNAIAVAGKGYYADADTLLSQFINAHPGDSLADWASKVLNYIRTAIPKS